MSLKSLAQRQAEQQDKNRYSNPFGNVGPDTTKLLVIYGRQSSIKQFVENIFSAEQQRDGLLKFARDVLQWRGAIKLLIENDVATKTSGRLPTDSRPGLTTVLEYVESGECSAVLSVDVSRLFRDETAIESAVFAGICKEHEVMVVTLDDIFDFNRPKRMDTSRFVIAAMQAGIGMSEQSRKMEAGRILKAEGGYIANGIAPVGMQLVQTGPKEKHVSLVASSHQPYLLK